MSLAELHYQQQNLERIKTKGTLNERIISTMYEFLRDEESTYEFLEKLSKSKDLMFILKYALNLLIDDNKGVKIESHYHLSGDKIDQRDDGHYIFEMTKEFFNNYDCSLRFLEELINASDPNLILKEALEEFLDNNPMCQECGSFDVHVQFHKTSGDDYYGWDSPYVTWYCKRCKKLC